jgi:hypothetical protein
MNFGFCYDAHDPADPLKHPGQIRGSFAIQTQTFGPPHQLINTEPRTGSDIGIARGQIPPEHDSHVFRTPPPDRRRQGQIPAGAWRIYRGSAVLEGHRSEARLTSPRRGLAQGTGRQRGLAGRSQSARWNPRIPCDGTRADPPV